MGAACAGSGLAITSEMLALVPKENKALSTSLGNSMVLSGGAFSGLIAAGILKIDLLKDRWMFWGREMSQYDAVLLAYGVMIVLMVVTLGLVPSVLRKTEWMPQER